MNSVQEVLVWHIFFERKRGSKLQPFDQICNLLFNEQEDTYINWLSKILIRGN